MNAVSVTELSDAAIDLHVEHARQLPSVHSTVHFYPINGAARRVNPDGIARSHRVASFARVIVGVDPDPANNGRTIAWSKADWKAPHPHPARTRPTARM